ncbi:TPA: hypothetical protein R1763_001566, partial [Campylobacter lari]|nr:hypothetical protein [Campylobacter lari]
RKFDPIFVYPSFKSELNTIDYKSDFKITVSGLLADSAVKVLKDEKVTPKKESFNVNDKGEATLEFSGISDYSIKDFKISIEYLKQGDIKDTKTSDTIKLHQYTPSISFSKDKIHAYESENIKALKDPKLDHVDVTIKGGKPNEKIEWSLSGDATLGNQEATFNASGEAKA